MYIPDFKKSFPLLGEHKNQIYEMLDAPVVSPDFLRVGEVNPKLRVFVVNFDGTNNDKSDVPKNEQKTLVANSHEEIEALKDPSIKSLYMSGVGTRGNFAVKLFEGVTGSGCERNAEIAHKKMIDAINQWKKEDPECKVHVHVTGFSRGAATALHFLNIVDKRGALAGNQTAADLPKDLQPTNITTTALLYDTVSTGQGEVLELTVPYSCIAATHIIAGGEERLAFPVRRIAVNPEDEVSLASGCRMIGGQKYSDGFYRYQRINELVIPGARHSDVGGAYLGGGLREVSQYFANYWHASLGLPVKVNRPTFEQINEARAHDSRFDIEKFFSFSNDLESRQNANSRLAERVQEDVWDGRVIDELIVEGLSRLPLVKKTIETIPDETLESMYDEFESDTKRRKMNVDMNSTIIKDSPILQKHFQKKASAISNSDENHDGQVPVISGESISGEVMGPKLPIHVTKKRAKLGVQHKAGQDPGASKPEPINPGQEPWMPEICKILMHLNKTDEMTSHAASKIMSSAFSHASAQIARMHPEVDALKIKPCVMVENIGARQFDKYSFQFDGLLKDGSQIGNYGFQFHAADPALTHDIKQLNNSLLAVAAKLKEFGFQPSATFSIDIKPGEPVFAKSTKMVGMHEEGPQRIEYTARATGSVGRKSSPRTSGPLWDLLGDRRKTQKIKTTRNP